MTITDIEAKTKAYAQAHRDLLKEVRRLSDALERLKREAMHGIRLAIDDDYRAKRAVECAILEHQDLFVAPRTYVFDGIKVGMQKARGGLSWDDPDQVVARIYKLFGDEQAGKYLHIEQAPDKDALAKLTVGELRKLGVEVVADSDRPVIKPAKSDVEKLVQALLAEEKADND